MDDLFELAGGSITGRQHRLSGKNNQDAWHYQNEEGCTFAVICDGCGSSPHSEVGAKVGARVMTDVLRRLNVGRDDKQGPFDFSSHEELLEQARCEVLEELNKIATRMGEGTGKTIADYFLFTIVGVWLTSHWAVFFSLGDGVLFVNGEQFPLGPYPNNAPPYLMYGLRYHDLSDSSYAMRFCIHASMPITDLHSFLIGSDGMQDFIRSGDLQIPGRTEQVGSHEQLWQQDKYFCNPDMIRRRLAGVNRDVVTQDPHRRLSKANGLLPDDTTLIVGRRRKQ